MGTYREGYPLSLVRELVIMDILNTFIENPPELSLNILYNWHQIYALLKNYL
jgi:hypothetical protein